MYKTSVKMFLLMTIVVLTIVIITRFQSKLLKGSFEKSKQKSRKHTRISDKLVIFNGEYEPICNVVSKQYIPYGIAYQTRDGRSLTVIKIFIKGN